MKAFFKTLGLSLYLIAFALTLGTAFMGYTTNRYALLIMAASSILIGLGSVSFLIGSNLSDNKALKSRSAIAPEMEASFKTWRERIRKTGLFREMRTRADSKGNLHLYLEYKGNGKYNCTFTVGDFLANGHAIILPEAELDLMLVVFYRKMREEFGVYDIQLSTSPNNGGEITSLDLFVDRRQIGFSVVFRVQI